MARTMADTKSTSHIAAVGEKGSIIDSVSSTVIRGKQSWDFLYTFLGFALTIEATLLSMIDNSDLHYGWRIFIFIILAAATGWIVLNCGWFQNWILGLKNRYESKGR